MKVSSRWMFTGYSFSFYILYFNVVKHQFILCVLYISFSLKGLLIFCSFFYWLYYWLPRFLYKISHLLWYQLLSFVFWLGFWCICMLCFSPLPSYPSGLPDSLYHKTSLVDSVMRVVLPVGFLCSSNRRRLRVGRESWCLSLRVTLCSVLSNNCHLITFLSVSPALRLLVKYFLPLRLVAMWMATNFVRNWTP